MATPRQRQSLLRWAPAPKKKPDYTGFNFPGLQEAHAAKVKADTEKYQGFNFKGLKEEIDRRARLKAAGSSAPPPPPPSSAGALPIDIQARLDWRNQGAASGLANTNTGLNQQQDRAASDYGYAVKYDVDPVTGARTVAANGLSVDPANPYSRAAALQRSYDQSKAGASNSFAARGQLYSGALQNAQNENARRFDEGNSSLRQGFLDFIARTEGARATARTAASDESTTAGFDALSEAMGRAPEDPGPTAAAEAPAPAAAVPKVPKPKGKDWKGGNVFQQTSGSRAGQWYRVIKQGGASYRFYSNGDKVKVS